MKEATIEKNAANLAAAWEMFQKTEDGVYPPKIAAAMLRLTVQGVHAASERGWIKYFRIGRERYYSAKDVRDYRWTGSRKWRDNRPAPRYVGQQDQTPPAAISEGKQKKLDEAKERAARREGWLTE